MKRRLFFVAISMLYSLSTFSQLSVNSSGKVTITNNGYRSLEINTRNEGIYVTRSGNSSSSTLASITGVCDKDGIVQLLGNLQATVALDGIILYWEVMILKQASVNVL